MAGCICRERWFLSDVWFDGLTTNGENHSGPFVLNLSKDSAGTSPGTPNQAI
jgi:hypothetical protein